MSQENVEIVKRALQAFNKGDFRGMWEDHAGPDFEYVSSGTIPGAGGVYRGIEEYTRFMETAWSEFDHLRAELDDVVETGNRVLYTLTMRGCGKQSRAETTWTFFQVWTFRDEKVVRGQGFTNRAEALQAAGLREHD